MEIFPDWTAALFLVLPFVVTFFALRAILFQPLIAYLEERDAVAGRAETETESFEAATADKMRALEEQLAGARRDIGEIRKSARAEAQAEEAKILAAARDAANEKVDAAVARISDEKQTAATTLRGTAKVLSADIAAQVLGRAAKEA